MEKVIIVIGKEEYYVSTCSGVFYELDSHRTNISIDTILNVAPKMGSEYFLPKNELGYYTIYIDKFLKKCFNLKGRCKNTSGYGFKSGEFNNKYTKFSFSIGDNVMCD
jgi:hypothetical protein